MIQLLAFSASDILDAVIRDKEEDQCRTVILVDPT